MTSLRNRFSTALCWLACLTPSISWAEAGQSPDVFDFIRLYASAGKYVIVWTIVSFGVFLLLRKKPQSKRERYTFWFWISPAICFLAVGLANDLLHVPSLRIVDQWGRSVASLLIERIFPNEISD